jgi:hypothetical protein
MARTVLHRVLAALVVTRVVTVVAVVTVTVTAPMTMTTTQLLQRTIRPMEEGRKTMPPERRLYRRRLRCLSLVRNQKPRRRSRRHRLRLWCH